MPEEKEIFRDVELVEQIKESEKNINKEKIKEFKY